MRWTAMLRLRVRSVLSGNRVERDLADEVQYHVNRLTEEYVAAGMPPEEARYAAAREMGGIDQCKEECRDARGLRWLGMLAGDLRYALRQIRKNPAFAVTAVVTLAVGIGANATLVAAISSVFRPLPVRNAEALSILATTDPHSSRVRQHLAYPDYQDYRAAVTAFSDMAAWHLSPVGLTADARTDRLMATAVTGSYFSTLGVEPAAGRLILPSDGEAGGTQPVVVLGHAYWTRRFAADPSVVGRQVRIDGRPFTVIGVAPERFHGTFTLVSSEAYVPLALFQAKTRLADRDALSVRVIARIRPGATLEEAQASVATVGRRLEQDHPATNAGRLVRVYPEWLARPEPQNVSQAVAVAALFLALVGAVFLVACANVLGLVLARGAGRSREMAIRSAVGASRWDLIRLCLVEALLIAFLGAGAGGLAGLAIAQGLATSATVPGVPLFLDLRLDGPTSAYLCLLLVVCTLVIGVLPAVRASRVAPRGELGGGTTSADVRRQFTRRYLATAQIAGSVVLLVVCGLFIRSLLSLRSFDLGFDSTRVLLAATDPSAVGYDSARAAAFYRSLDAALESLPEVECAATSVFVPFGTGNSTPYAAPENQPPPTSTTGLLTDRQFVTGDYFRTVGTPLGRGRSFAVTDTPDSTRVAVVNEALARRLWSGADPLGRRFRASSEPDLWLEVIGVVRDAVYTRSEMGERTQPRFFVSADQFSSPTRTLLVRSRGTAARALAATVQATVRRLDPAVPVYDVYTLEHQIDDSGGGFGSVKGAAAITGTLGLAALALALVGTYGLLSFMVRARRREIGVRMAFGLQPKRVFLIVMWSTWRIALPGLVIGLGLGLAAGRVLQGVLFGVAPHDLATFVTVALLVAVIATLVGLLPAYRALRTNPIETLRCE